MEYDLIIKNGQIVSPEKTYKSDIGVQAGKIVNIGDLSKFQSKSIYDANGKYVFPGFIDEHVHTREPGLTYKEDFAHATRSAAAGGVTTIIDMPNTVPPISNVDSLDLKLKIASTNAFVDFALLGIVLGDTNIKDLEPLADAGVVGFKLFWGYALDPKTYELVYNFKVEDDHLIMPPDHGQIFEAFSAIAKMNRTVAIHAEDVEIISRLVTKESSRGSDYSSLLRARPAFAEELTIQAGITIANAAGVNLHILHIATGEGADLVGEARHKGIKVTGETCPHYLTLTDEDFSRAGTDMKIFPLIREKHHQERLMEGLQKRKLQTVGSDHAPHSYQEKLSNIWDAPAGTAGVQTIVSVMLDCVSKGKLSMNQIAEVLSENPAKIWGLYGKKGVIMPGADADFAIVDMEKEIIIRKEDLLSKNQITPYDGLTKKGAPVATFLRGIQVMEDGKLLDNLNPNGQFVKPVTKVQPIL